MDAIFVNNVPGTTGKLASACVGLAGCGGLGSNAAVALARAGVGRLILADHDVVEPSNLNRQHFFQGDIGKKKVVALSNHLRSVNPDIRLDARDLELDPSNIHEVFADASILIEAFDRAESKRWLIEAWWMRFPGRPLVSGNGLAGYGRTADLAVTRAGNLYFCGDGRTDRAIGLCSARVGIVANMQANVAIELLLKGRLR